MRVTFSHSSLVASAIERLVYYSQFSGAFKGSDKTIDGVHMFSHAQFVTLHASL